MNVDRRRFMIGLGAFATASASGRGRAFGQPLETMLTSDLGNQGVLYRLSLDIGDITPLSCTAAVLPRSSFRAKILEQRERSAGLTAVHDLGKAAGATVAINGGPFNGAFDPDGLLIVDGKMVGRKRADWSGMLTIDDAGNASVTEEPHLEAARYAVQGYPTIVEPSGEIGIKRDDGQRFRRTVIAQSGDVIVAIVTSRVSLFSLAYALIEHAGAFSLNRIDAAINLSGAATTGFYAKLPNGSEVTVESFWPNRDVIAFLPR